MNRWIHLIFWLMLALACDLFLAKGFKEVPGLGPRLAIHGGLWDHTSVTLRDRNLRGLKQSVEVIYDKAGVPHFFAQNEADLYFVQGYVMASQRLFQMDLSTRVTDGRLSEWFGQRTEKMDRFYLQFGMRDSARRTLEEFNQDPKTKMTLQAFSDGVNAYIDQARELPPEYKMLQKTPEPFSPLKVIHMDKALSFNLAGRSFDTYLSQIRHQLGTEFVLDLFPDRAIPGLEDSITSSEKHKLQRPRENANQFVFSDHFRNIPYFPLPSSGKGSNNWAVDKTLSTSGHSLFANDTHLGMALPNIWFENQLWTPEFNVYGVALTAVPGIINGLNAHVAWGPTNGTTDVLDFYEIEFADEVSLKYRSGSGWLTAEKKSEEFRDRDGVAHAVEVISTPLGYLLHREGRYGLIASWLAHRTHNEFKALRGLYSVKNIDDCLTSFTNWAAPIQNFICADHDDVAIQHTGSIPRRPIGQGRFIMDGSSVDQPFPQLLSEAERPKRVRPSDHFVLSANQRVVDEYSPLYLGWDFEEFFRAATIRRRLTSKKQFAPEDFIKMQNDAYDLPAEMALPWLLQGINEATLDPDQLANLSILRSWDYLDLALTVPPTLFKEWYQQTKILLYDSIYKVAGYPFWPREARTIEILRNVVKDPRHPDQQYISQHNHFKSAEDLITQAYLAAWHQLVRQYGANSKEWFFKRWSQTQFPHAGRFPGFGSEVLSVDGGGESIRGNKGKQGPVYKLVAEMSEWPRAWIQVPGGNEGDPFHPDYGKFVLDWAKGGMRAIEFYHSVDEARAQAARIVHFQPEGT